MTFSYKVKQHTPKYFWIEDTCLATGKMSITNAAEEAVIHFLSNKLLKEGQRFFYTDTMGEVDEIVHDGKRFLRFQAGNGGLFKI